MNDRLKKQVNEIIENCSIEDLKELREMISLEIEEEERKRIAMNPEFEQLLLLPLKDFLNNKSLKNGRVRINTFVRVIEAINREKNMEYLKNPNRKDPIRVYEAIGIKIKEVKKGHDIGIKTINSIEKFFNYYGISLDQELSQAQLEYLNHKRNSNIRQKNL